MRPQFLLYVASKGAINQITRVLAKDLGTRNITVNAISPSATDTDMFRVAVAHNPSLVTELANLHPQKRIGRPDEISPIAAFLASDEASWVNGQNIYANGVGPLYRSAHPRPNRLNLPGIRCLRCLEGFVRMAMPFKRDRL